MKTIIYFLGIMVYFSSCNGVKSYSNMVVSNDSTYWDYYNPRKKIVTDCYLFKDNGECLRYIYTKEGKLLRFDDDDVIVPDTWKILGDTIISIRGLELQILSITSDSMILENQFHDTLLFKKNLEQLKKINKINNS